MPDGVGKRNDAITLPTGGMNMGLLHYIISIKKLQEITFSFQSELFNTSGSNEWPLGLGG